MKTKSFLPLLSNDRGAALLVTFLVLTVLLTLSVGFALSSIVEFNNARRYRDSTTAYWLAEAGINEYLADTTYLDGGPQTIDFGDNSVTVSKDDSDPTVRIVTAVGAFNTVTRRLEVEFPANPPPLFDNTINAGGNVELFGMAAILEVYGKTRVTGQYVRQHIFATAWFENKLEGVDQSQTTLRYPDSNNNGTSDEFNDFVEFNRDVISTYPPEEVVYIQSNNTQVIFPQAQLTGKKVIYVEGGAAGQGDVHILFDTTWADGENVTVISTGSIKFLQPLQVHRESKLNTISWDDYDEASIFYSAHGGVTYAHDDINLFSVLSYSESKGTLISNDRFYANETLTRKIFRYDNTLENGLVAPGFAGLVTAAAGGYSSTPSAWRDI